MQLLRLLAAITAVLMLSATLKCQTVQQRCDHKDNSIERFKDIRLLPALQIYNYDPVNLEVVYGDKNGLEYKKLTVRPDSAVPSSVDKKKWYWILYSECDQSVEAIVPVLPGQMK